MSWRSAALSRHGVEVRALIRPPHQPVVADDAVIVAVAPVIRDRTAVAERVEQPFPERRGHRHIGRDRQHGRGDRRIDRPDAGRAGEHHVAGAHRGVRRRDALAHAGRIDRERGRVLEDARAVLLGIGREAERVVERMDVERFWEMQRLKILRAAQHRARDRSARPPRSAEIDAQHCGMLDQRRRRRCGAPRVGRRAAAPGASRRRRGGTYSTPASERAHSSLARGRPTRSTIASIRSANPGETDPPLRPDAPAATRCASSTPTDQPRRASSRATVSPGSPAPITQASTSRLWLSAVRSGAATMVAEYQDGP